jgi:hypothetical protein
MIAMGGAGRSASRRLPDMENLLIVDGSMRLVTLLD